MRFRPRLLLFTLAIASVMSHAANAQSVRGVVTDATSRPVAGVVVQLLDTLGGQVARALTNEAGDFRLTAPRAGTYRIRGSRIGFRPTFSATFSLAAGETRAEALQLSGIEFALDTVRVQSSNSCRGTVESGAATFAVFEQARTALLATELTGAARGISATTLDYERSLDAGGHRVRSEKSRMRSQTVRQPWTALAPDSLHRSGYVVRGADDSTTYYAPGLDMLASDLFVADHCFELRREGNKLAIAFEPTRDRRNLAEIRGTLWLDLATSHLQRLEYTYVNLPSEVDASAGGELSFARLKNGGWAINRWRIRMPVIERRLGSQRTGTTGMRVVELSEQGGELVMAVRDNDTLWAQPKRVLKGVAVDSSTGRPLAGVRLQVVGVGRNATSNDHGQFEIQGLLPGDYSVELRTSSLDSIGGRHETLVEFRDNLNVELRVPTPSQFMALVCGDVDGTPRAGVFGKLKILGNGGVPGDARIQVEWLDPKLRQGSDAIVVSRERQSRTIRPDSAGAFKLCDVPAETDLAVRVETDSALVSPLRVRLTGTERFARLEIPVDRTISMYASLTGVVRRDSGFAVVGAEVALEDVYKVAITDTNGVFRIRDVPPGEHHLIVRKLGLAGFDTVITFVRNVESRQNVSLRRTTLLSTVKTTASRLPPTFYEHQRMGLGDFLTRIDLEKQEGRSLGATLTQLRGMRVVMGGVGNHAWVASNRRPDCLRGMICPADTFFNVDRNKGQIPRCYAKVYLDNVLQNRGKPTPPFDANEIKVDRIEAIEYFAGAAEVAMEYSGMDTNCGVLVIHTRKSP